ncbi:insulinase family protein [Massilia forsythiae]|uniref:Insulinase family protein n=1 Tax=Massilia forsythiae TaxID=2728020 RepID=A0A7Z2VX30_9BURK|nr:pitrilysin family protein [Massilia forsythiae]QJE00457.1 insulinase family protein [Massilia forsythiae]
MKPRLPHVFPLSRLRPLFLLPLLAAPLPGAHAAGQDGAGLPPTALLPEVAAVAASPAALPRVAFEKTVLPNGLELILVEDHRLPIVAVNIWYHVGPANEAPGLTGFAHLFEHMMFAGTRHLPRGLADRLLEGAGATDSNGSTDYDRTNYYDTVPSNRLELALWVHADRMGYLLDVLDQAALSNQQDVVRNERRQSVENRPYGIVEEALNHALFPQDHPYYAAVIGSHADIQNAKLADVRDFFARYYGPNNASIVIAGDIDKRKTRALVDKYFGSFKRSAPVAAPVTVTPPIARERRVTVADRVELPRLYMGWLTPPAYRDGDAELAVTAQILAGGKSSRLYKTLVYERQIAQEAAAAQNANALVSTFVIDATARPGHGVDELERAIDAELAALRDLGPSDAEVERARNTIETAMLGSIEKLGGDGLADRLNHYNQATGDPGYLARDIERLRRVSALDVRRVVRDYLRPDARVLVAGVPGKPALGPDLPVPAAAQPAGAAEPASGAAEADGATPAITLAPAVGAAAVPPAPAAINRDEPWRNTPPRPGPAPVFALPRRASFKLPNGLTVIHHYNPALPLVAAELVVRSGSDANPEDRPGLAGFTAQLLQEGTATRSAPRIADEIAQLGAFLGSESGADASTVSLLSLRATFAQALDVLADVVQHPAFPTAEVERQRAARLGDLARRRDDPALVAAVAAAGALYGQRHPYGYGQLGTEAAIRAVTRNELAAFWRRHYVPSNAALVVSGAITQDELRALALARFGAWTPAVAAPAAPGKPAGSGARLVIVDKPGAPQTALRVATLAAPRATPDYAAMEVMNAALGGLFSSRINLNLREDKGYSYGMFSSFRYHRTPGPFTIAGSVRTDVTGASVAEIFREVRKLRERVLPPQELAGARDAQVYSLPGRFETNSGIGASLAETWVFDLPPDYWNTLPGRFRRVDAAQVRAAAGKYLRPDRMTVVAVGDRARIAPQLAPLGLGRPETRDTDGLLP